MILFVSASPSELTEDSPRLLLSVFPFYVFFLDTPLERLLFSYSFLGSPLSLLDLPEPLLILLLLKRCPARLRTVPFFASRNFFPRGRLFPSVFFSPAFFHFSVFIFGAPGLRREVQLDSCLQPLPPFRNLSFF